MVFGTCCCNSIESTCTRIRRSSNSDDKHTSALRSTDLRLSEKVAGLELCSVLATRQGWLPPTKPLIQANQSMSGNVTVNPNRLLPFLIAELCRRLPSVFFQRKQSRRVHCLTPILRHCHQSPIIGRSR